jgi:SAM-dependent methyltransferase
LKEFDKYAGNYDSILNEGIKLSGFSSGYFDEYKIREIYLLLREKGLADKPLRFLNFGCGIGKSERLINRYFSQVSIHSVDISEESISIARNNNKDLGNAVFSIFDGVNIPFSESYDVILIAGVLHHIPAEDHEVILRNLFRCLGARGSLFIFEHNPLNPLTRRVVQNCELDINAVLLKPSYTGRLLLACGFKQRTLRYIVFFPFFLHLLIPLEKYLRKIPLGAQYYFIAEKGQNTQDG